MLKSCTYCGKIHDKKYICQEKEKAEKIRHDKMIDRQKKYNRKKVPDTENKFRWGRKWKKKAESIKRRDLYLCQACIRNLHGTVNQYNSHQLSVHHIVKLRDDYSRRLDDDNLITLCRMHHEMAEHGEIQASVLAEIAKVQCGEQEDTL